MQNIQNVDQHVHEHVMTNVIQVETSKSVEQSVSEDVFVRRVLFLERMVNVSNLKFVASQSKDHIKDVVQLVHKHVPIRIVCSVFFHVFLVASVTKITYAKVIK
jgi:hypothetical protein